MDAGTLHQLLADNRALVSDTWNFYLSVHLAIFGIIFIVNGRVAAHERLLLTAAYLGFAFVNFQAQMENYQVQGEILAQIAALPADAAGDAARTIALGAQPAWIVQYLREGYGGVAFVAVCVIFFTNRGRGNPTI